MRWRTGDGVEEWKLTVMIICKTDEQNVKALPVHVESICEKVVIKKNIIEKNKVLKRVIKGTQVEEDLDKIKRNIVEVKVNSLNRLMRMVNEERVGSTSIIIVFRNSYVR